METASRTQRSIKNMAVSLIYFGVAALLQFVARKIFIDRLGLDVLGLNSTATNLLQFLNLAELGVGVAVGYALYRPIADGNRRAIAEIVALQGHIYRRVALVVIGGGVVLCCFFPLIFKGMALPMWYAYASFGVIMLSSLLSYFVSYKQIVFSADQREYMVKYYHTSAMIIKVGLQTLAVALLDHPYVWWLIIEAMGAVGSASALHFGVRHHYPYLKERIENTAAELRRRYPEIVANTRRLFIHRISDYVLRQTSSLVIYACVSMAMVALYGNYMLVITALLTMLEAATAGILASVGSLVAEGDTRRIAAVFSEMLAMRFFISAVFTAAVVVMMPPLVVLWLGRDYLLSTTLLYILGAVFFINSFRQVIDAFKIAYGLFADVWAAVAEAALNLGLSVAFGLIWGVEGVVAGVLVSLVVIVMGWKPFYLMRSGMHMSLLTFWRPTLLYIAMGAGAAVVTIAVASWVKIDPAESVVSFIFYGIATCGTFTIVLGSLMMALAPGARSFAMRIINFIKRP